MNVCNGSYPDMSPTGPGCVKTRKCHETGGTKTPPYMPIAPLWASGEAGFLRGVHSQSFHTASANSGHMNN